MEMCRAVGRGRNESREIEWLAGVVFSRDYRAFGRFGGVLWCFEGVRRVSGVFFCEITDNMAAGWYFFSP